MSHPLATIPLRESPFASPILNLSPPFASPVFTLSVLVPYSPGSHPVLGLTPPLPPLIWHRSCPATHHPATTGAPLPGSPGHPPGSTVVGRPAGGGHLWRASDYSTRTFMIPPSVRKVGGYLISLRSIREKFSKTPQLPPAVRERLRDIWDQSKPAKLRPQASIPGRQSRVDGRIEIIIGRRAAEWRPDACLWRPSETWNEVIGRDANMTCRTRRINPQQIPPKTRNST